MVQARYGGDDLWLGAAPTRDAALFTYRFVALAPILPLCSASSSLDVSQRPQHLELPSRSGSLALARRADDRELLEHGADVADIGLTEEEKRELLTG